MKIPTPEQQQAIRDEIDQQFKQQQAFIRSLGVPYKPYWVRAEDQKQKDIDGFMAWAMGKLRPRVARIGWTFTTDHSGDPCVHFWTIFRDGVIPSGDWDETARRNVNECAAVLALGEWRTLGFFDYYNIRTESEDEKLKRSGYGVDFGSTLRWIE